MITQWVAESDLFNNKVSLACICDYINAAQAPNAWVKIIPINDDVQNSETVLLIYESEEEIEEDVLRGMYWEAIS